ncbi:hypothetical protein [Spelaeicoccus albus]|uniref:Uncharacterized protein n=1 Tax=Spelaeicoccus albus TaxID=1280376 RepID=A0A7Z0A9Y1_9MICO|nr:hypothetical protein [Spelaeicoccus albus]NYI67132.1 hypothetical protein [Spelaeicoccus albus]
MPGVTVLPAEPDKISRWNDSTGGTVPFVLRGHPDRRIAGAVPVVGPMRCTNTKNTEPTVRV